MTDAADVSVHSGGRTAYHCVGVLDWWLCSCCVPGGGSMETRGEVESVGFRQLQAEGLGGG